MGYRNNNTPARQNTSLARHNASDNVAQIAQIVRDYEKSEGNIVLTPASSISHIPDDHALVVRQLQFDERRDFYYGQGGFALHKGALERVAAAAGIKWDVDRTRRLDDRSDPNYCEYQAVGAVRDPQTGEIIRKKGTKAMDLRDGSAAVEEIYEKKRADVGTTKNHKYKTIEEAERAARKELNGLRVNIVERAETGAYLRVIRSVTALRNNYTAAEKNSTFVLVSLVYQPKDPETRRLHRLQAAKAAQDLFYGGRGMTADDGIIDIAPSAPSAPPAIGDDGQAEVRELERKRTPGDSIPPIRDFVDMSHEDRLQAVTTAIDLASFDYDGTMSAAGWNPVPDLERLPDKWLQALFEACSEQVEPGNARPFDDDEIPF